MAQWLAASGGSLAITTYTSGKLVLVGTWDDRLRFRARRFPRPMGVAIRGDRLALAIQKKLLLFHKRNAAYTLEREFDTGKVDAHDVAFGRRGIYFANTRYNCIARNSDRTRFVRCWQPPFFDEVVPRDRCHLNGLGMQSGRPRLATAFCETSHKGGWREQNRFTGGVLIDIAQNQVVTRGLCMPHSPRYAAGKWWLCNSGHGLLSTFDLETAACEEFCALPGFTRGLCLVGNHALVGLSKIRKEHILDAPPVREHHEKIVAGVALVDLRLGNQVGLLEFVSGGNEVYDVVFLPGQESPDLVVPEA